MHELLPWDGPELASRLAGRATSGPLAAILARAEAVVAYTRAGSLAQALRPRGGRLFQHDPSPPPGGAHAAWWLAQPLAALGLRPAAERSASEGPPPDLGFSSAEHAAAAALLSALPPSFLAVHPGSGSPAKCWPPDRFAALADRLAKGSPFLVVLGPAEERQRYDDVPGAVTARELPLRTLGALLSHAGLFVGNDSGVSHLAAACGAPTLALFGPTDPALWAPVGRRVQCLRAPDSTLEALTTDAVAEQARGLTSAASGPPRG